MHAEDGVRVQRVAYDIAMPLLATHSCTVRAGNDALVVYACPQDPVVDTGISASAFFLCLEEEFAPDPVELHFYDSVFHQTAFHFAHTITHHPWRDKDAMRARADLHMHHLGAGTVHDSHIDRILPPVEAHLSPDDVRAVCADLDRICGAVPPSLVACYVALRECHTQNGSLSAPSVRLLAHVFA